MNRYKRIAKTAVSVLAMLLLLVFSAPVAKVHALSDIDFTIDVDTSREYIAGNTIDAPILIKTQTENGYVEMTMLLRYNQDALSCSSIYDDVNGFTTTIVDDGLNIYYKSPDNSKSPIDTTYKLNIQFTVKTGVASGKYKLELDVDTNNVYGYDKNGNKDKGLLTISDANAKELTIIETGDSITAATDSGDEANFYTGIATTAQDVENGGGSGGCVSAGGVIAFIIGSLVIFVAGVVVGFLLCQKRMNEEGYYMNNTFGRGGISENRPQGMAPGASDPAGDGFENPQGGMFDDIPSEGHGVRPEPYGDPRQPSFPAAQSDDGFDTSYFGQASSQRIGDPGNARFEQNDYDDGFPEAFKPRRARSNSDNRFNSEFETILEQSRRQRDDDGYGSFSSGGDSGNYGSSGGNYGGSGGNYGSSGGNYGSSGGNYGSSGGNYGGSGGNYGSSGGNYGSSGGNYGSSGGNYGSGGDDGFGRSDRGRY